MTSKQEISEWFDRGVANNATHLIVVCDTYAHEDYADWAHGDEDCMVKYRQYLAAAMQRVMEVYDLRQPKEPQMRERRSFMLPRSSVSP